jgi:hypothetical protein
MTAWFGCVVQRLPRGEAPNESQPAHHGNTSDWSPGHLWRKPASGAASVDDDYASSKNLTLHHSINRFCETFVLTS